MAKKKVKNKRPSTVWKKYSVKAGKLERKPTCPKCGPGMFLAEHKDRLYCGKCHYIQIIKK
ncbi:MAG: 30S ribosomal protein S27ae [Nanoarchaeota archaeon]